MLTRFEWDAAKAVANLRKHGVSFEMAMRVFADPFALTRPERPTEKKGDVMSKKSVKREVELANLPPLSAKQKAELAALAARREEEVDYSDTPPLSEEFWKNAERGKFYKPTKTSTTVRIDSDVLAWLRSQGKGYQSRINAILRREMLSSLKASGQ